MTTSPPIRFGSTDSRDLDHLYLAERLPDPAECKAFCSGKVDNRNLIVLRDGVVAETYKGLPDETNNAVMATYSLHPQEGPNPIERRVKRNVPLKMVRATRMMLAALTRTAHRTEVKDALASNNVARRIETLAKIDFRKVELTPDAVKSIAFQLGQTNALIENVELYTKTEIADYCEELQPLLSRQSAPLDILNVQRDVLLHKLSGVYVRQKGDLNLLMYGNALAIDDWNQYARQCRGMVIDVVRERCVFFPMDKFFRFGEGPELSRNDVSLSNPVEIVEKADGSMVSLVDFNGHLEFVCKGNFDTEQSRRADLIAGRLPVAKLDTSRYNHVFEVIYPENRFPQGLSIVDYGDREDLVLTAMRDRLTNELLPYAEVVNEARRVGLSHPEVFAGSLGDAFSTIDSSDHVLGTEGFVIRDVASGRYFKLKFPAYKDVLMYCNSMRSNRFVRDFVRMNSEERQRTMQLLPGDIRKAAQSQLEEHADIVRRLSMYSAAVRALADSANSAAMARVINERVPEELRKLVFAEHRGIDATLLVERAAMEIYEGRREFSELHPE